MFCTAQLFEISKSWGTLFEISKSWCASSSTHILQLYQAWFYNSYFGLGFGYRGDLGTAAFLLLLGVHLLFLWIPSFFYWVPLCFPMCSPLVSNGSPSLFYWALLCFLLGSSLHLMPSSVFYCAPLCFLAGSPTRHIGFPFMF